VSTPPREGPTTAKRAQVQADVLRATEELLAAGSSYADLNVEKIATAAGISRTAFYFYFRDKKELLMRLAGDVAGELYMAAEEWFAGDGRLDDEIRAAIGKIADLYADHGVLLRAVTEVSTYDEEVAGYWRGLLGRFVDATERRIAIEAQDAPAGAVPARAMAFALVWGTERTFYEQFVQGQPLDRDTLIDGLVLLYTRTIYGSDA
jgi:TetR/AcrR family transcriptional regulator, ethionamide resistance regulator